MKGLCDYRGAVSSTKTIGNIFVRLISNDEEIPLTSYLFDGFFVTSMSDNVFVEPLLEPLKDISSAVSL